MRHTQTVIALRAAVLAVSLLWGYGASADSASATFGVSARVRHFGDHAFLRHQADGQLSANIRRKSHLRIEACEGEGCVVELAPREVAMRHDGAIQFRGRTEHAQAVQLVLQYE